MKRRRRRLIRIGIALLVLAAVFVFKEHFNGKFIYFTTGFDRHTLFEAGSQTTYDYEAEILFSDIRSQYEALFGSDVWSRQINGMSFETYAKDQVKTKLIRIACMNEMAQNRGVVLSREESSGVTKAAKEYMDAISAEQKSAIGVTNKEIENMYTKFAIANRLYTDMTGNIRTEISADYARVIIIQYISSNSLETINSAKAKLDAGGNFFYVARETNENPEYEYELRRGEMEKNFEEAAYNLASGEVSDVVEAGGRYYIIKCISDNEKTKTEANRNDIMEALKLEEFNKVFEPFEASVYLNFNEKLWGELEFRDLHNDEGFENIFNRYFK